MRCLRVRVDAKEGQRRFKMLVKCICPKRNMISHSAGVLRREMGALEAADMLSRYALFPPEVYFQQYS
jgi:hypothetical protein